MNRFYILPYISQVGAKGQTKAPKYIFENSTGWGAIPYGTEPICICYVSNIDQTQHNQLTAQSDVLAIPENIDQNLTQNAVDTASAFLELLNIPAQWVNTNLTYRQVLKVLIGLFQLNQRWAGLTGGNSLFNENLDLNTTYSELTQTAKDRILECFDTLNIDRSMLNNSTTIREALREFGTQFATRPIKIYNVTL